MSFSLQDIDLFQELTFFYSYFKNCHSIDFNLKSSSTLLSKNHEFAYLLTSYQLPFQFYELKN